MVRVTYEEMIGEIEHMLLARLGSENRRNSEAEQKLKDWFAARGIILEFAGWENWNTDA